MGGTLSFSALIWIGPIDERQDSQGMADAAKSGLLEKKHLSCLQQHTLLVDRIFFSSNSFVLYLSFFSFVD